MNFCKTISIATGFGSWHIASCYDSMVTMETAEAINDLGPLIAIHKIANFYKVRVAYLASMKFTVPHVIGPKRLGVRVRFRVKVSDRVRVIK